ncbi:MAG: endopeptidase La [Lachnospiraceae bacterium]|jgi:ATP-dependent Lon protease|nr:endopeptidase La [Lachnospiraceae bacterium]
MNEVKRRMPAIPLRGLTVLPTMVLHFDISRKSSIQAVEAAMEKDQIIFLVTQRNPDDNNPGLRGLYELGVIAKIRNVAKLPKDIVRVMVEGIQKGRLLEGDAANGYLEVQVEPAEEQSPQIEASMAEAMVRALRDLLVRYGQLNQKFGKDMQKQLLEIQDLEKLTMAVSVHLPMYYEDRQKLLEKEDIIARYHDLSALIVNEMEILQIRNEIQQKVKERVDKNQREYVLREQIKIIQEELGEDGLLSDVKHYQEAAQALCASAEVKEKIRKEAERLKSIGNNPAENSVLRTYIETLLELPWDKTSEDNRDLKNAERILNEDHYGLEKVKERILEFLAVRCLNHKGDSPILCLVGPPGTGKTSIARSVARALDKKYVRISLGGVRDEAEIRGHRRTYIGAMPGRLAAGMRQAGVKNPLMLLDEIDKVSSDYKGDTSSALLEVLDSEQNCKFRDHYVEVPIDLSEVLFIATANDLQTIPRPLLDRMEIIEVSSYTANEKLHIVREHLVKKQMEHHGLAAKQLTITKSALESVISGYTKEAGVRQLERKIGEICRKAAREILEHNVKCVRVSEKNLEKYLGRKRFTIKKKNTKNDVGIVRGLAWTSVGGDTLQIEVNTMPGKGEFLLTGQLGDVMKESARTAISYVRSLGNEYRIDAEFFSKNDIHIHIPAGAVPKDGPSAGITMATAILSAITGIPVRADVAMTGEITLRGRVLPIGGLKEKLLAAKQAGITTVLVPSENKPDIAEMQEEITGGLELVYVSAMPEVLKTALVCDKKEK